MNIFAVDEDPLAAARALCDQHIVKMPIESATMLSNWVDDPPYKPAWSKHPCTLWTGASFGNWFWHLDHARALCDEYTRRYGRVHKSEAAIDYCARQMPDFIQVERTPFALAMPHKIRHELPADVDPVLAYRHYYNRAKSVFARWRHSDPPSWWAPNPIPDTYYEEAS